MRSRVAVFCLSVALTAAVSTPGFAQKKVVGTPMEVGVVGGVNIFTFGGSDASGANSRTSFYAGLALTRWLGPSFFVQPQVLYSGQGATATVVDPTLGTVDATFKLTYLEIPVLLGVHIGANQQSGFRLFAGPTVGFKLSCNFEATAQGVTGSTGCGSEMESTDFGATGGVGFALPVGRNTVSVGGRYTLGFSKVFTGGADIKNQGFSVGAGIAIPLGRK